MIFIDPEQHGKTGTALPYWLSFQGDVVARPEENHIRRALWQLLGGNGSMMPEADQRWAITFIEGWLVLMFRTAEDRDLARLVL